MRLAGLVVGCGVAVGALTYVLEAYAPHAPWLLRFVLTLVVITGFCRAVGREKTRRRRRAAPQVS